MIKKHVAELIDRLEAGLKENHEETAMYKDLVKRYTGSDLQDFWSRKLKHLKEENQKLVSLIEYLEDGLKDLK